ncbi:unnamed protein product [Fraxinus pennsylvanica]|uniref:Uncharacterized protein n=1 Tax=Fraxinus pennsylvanica TaxID=56036 RepID=A0AAD1ZC78_9LAMI|nr:unnamed protein product [Fraxinus pennsylvanica]
MIQKTPSQSQNKSYSLMGNVYRVMMELHLELPFRAPNVGEAIRDIPRSKEAAILAPLETIRTRMVVGVGSRNIYGSFIQIVEQQGALSGLTASTISYPLEVARKRLMVGALQGKWPPHMSAALLEVVKQEGLMRLYRGWAASCLKVMPSSGITWMLYEAWKDILLAERRPL